MGTEPSSRPVLPQRLIFSPLFTGVRGMGILRSSHPEIATRHTKIVHMEDAPSTSCLLTWRCYVTR
jgi:hypothetical protein